MLREPLFFSCVPETLEYQTFSILSTFPILGLLKTKRAILREKLMNISYPAASGARGGEKKASICIGRHSSAPLNSIAIATFVQIVPQWPLSSLPRSPVSSWRETRCKQRILPAPARGRKGPKGRKRSIHE